MTKEMTTKLLPVISRTEARERGLKRYFTAKPCSHGHIAERYTCDTWCVDCKRDKLSKAHATHRRRHDPVDHGDDTKINYAYLKRLSKQLGRSMPDLVVLKTDNDPFYADVPARRERAEWFADLWQQFGFGTGTHVRRVHYRIVSQSTPVILPTGKRYLNTDYCAKQLIWAARDARILGLVDSENFIDQRNGETVVKQSRSEEPAGIYVEAECDLAMPEPPRMWLQIPTILQPYHVEIIAEKSTIDDVLEPIAERYRVNYTSCAGEISLTRCFELIQRAKVCQRPVRIPYVSDFDPAGRISMPVACARKLEFLIRDGELDDLDIQLRPVVLTKEQCLEYNLPRTPLKDGERRAESFEEQHGEGGTELDALEALHPGVLRQILVDEIERYYDTNLESKIRKTARDVTEEIDEINDSVAVEFEEEHERLRSELADLTDRIDVDEAPTPLRPILRRQEDRRRLPLLPPSRLQARATARPARLPRIHGGLPASVRPAAGTDRREAHYGRYGQRRDCRLLRLHDVFRLTGTGHASDAPGHP
jgi:hypothetical protein